MTYPLFSLNYSGYAICLQPETGNKPSACILHKYVAFPMTSSSELKMKMNLQLLLFRKTWDHCREPPQPPFSLIPASAPPSPFLSLSRPADVVQTVFLYPKTSYPQGPSLTFCLFSMESSTSVLHWPSLYSSQCWSRLSHPQGTFSIFAILATIMALLSYLTDLPIKAVWIAMASLLLIKDETWLLLLSVDSMSVESTIFLVTESNFPTLVKD